ncbi:hypothetical protein JOF56_003672 [Kibdelosporangium banguiense]|uniref:Uncharacterized protein n=1 Tax=Kibdelosporangium banguiense TaxID=1365924 RepID=A0ABS4TFU1_9PSEU|nr:hypothetical protein [Kibdelosporangium banguiense]MBP2323287.1 hypothetical protein [Kibdelosporangium banguiense]
MRTSLDQQDTQDLALPPVFVDPSGRRRRIVRYVALGACALFVCYLIAFIAALLGAPIPRSGLIPLPAAPVQPTQWQDPVQNGTPPGPPASNGPAAGTSERAEPSRDRGGPQTGGPAVSATAGSPETATVTPAAGSALTPERPNSNAATAPPGLTKHSESNPGRNGR